MACIKKVAVLVPGAGEDYATVLVPGAGVNLVVVLVPGAGKD